MTQYKNAIAVATQFIANTADIKSTINKYRRSRNHITEPAKHMAVCVLDKNQYLIDGMQKAIGNALRCTVNHDYPYRVLSYIIQDAQTSKKAST